MSELKGYRDEIDQIDQELTRLVEARFNVVKKVGEYKKKHDLPVLDAAREDVVIKRNQDRLENKAYSNDIAAFYKLLMQVTKDMQK